MTDRKHPLAACETCPLAGRENTFVPTKHATGQATLVVVGEAPGWQEATYQVPFTGPSGQLLKKVLKHYKYKPSEVTFTNACLCRPPSNATPPKAAVNACRGRLMAELAQSGAADILALGGTAVSAVVDDPRAITTLRVGPPKRPTVALKDSNVTRVVPTWHPAYCLRNADAFPTMVGDIGKLREKLFGQWQEPEWVAAEEEDHALKILDHLDKTATHLVTDIEVGIEKDLAFGHPNEFDMLCVGLQGRKGEAFVVGEQAFKFQSVIEALKRLFHRKKIIAHNGKFDLAGLYPHLGGLELSFDTMLAHYALDERPGTHGLKILAVERLGAPKYDDEIKQFVPRRGNYADIPRPILYKYNAFDVACTWDLFELFDEALDRDNVRRVHDHMVRASNELMYLELNGIAIDRAYSRELESDYLERLSAYEVVFNDIVSRSTGGIFSTTEITSINPRSPKQLKEYFATQGVRTESTDVEHLQAIAGRVDPRSSIGQFVGELLKYRREQKLYGTYVKGIRNRTYRGRVYTTYLLHGTTSGRLASRNPNLQNIVRDQAIRRQFSVSDPANVLIQCDYKNAELRVMADLAQDPYLQSLMNNPDPKYKFFNELSDQLYGVGNWTKEEYVRTKAFVYGIGYGREPYSIAMEFGITPQEAERRYAEFTALIPQVVKWQNRVREQVLNGDTLTTPFGRKRRFALITNENRKDVLNEALSFLPQSTASDICLDALVHTRPRLKGKGWLRMTIHDALIAECPEKNVDEVVAIMQEEMVASGARYTNYVPFPVDTSVGKSWGDL